MPTDLSRADPLIDGLVADLGPVRPRRWRGEAALLAGLALVEILLFIAVIGVRPDMPEAMGGMTFWWKSGSLAALALLSVAAVLVSLDPATTTARRLTPLWRTITLAVPVLLAAGWLLDAGAAGRAALIARLDWREGLDCLKNVGTPVAAAGGGAGAADATRRLDPAGPDGACGGAGSGGVWRLCLRLPLPA